MLAWQGQEYVRGCSYVGNYNEFKPKLEQTWCIPAWIPSSSFWSPASSEMAPLPVTIPAPSIICCCCCCCRWLSMAEMAGGAEGWAQAEAAPKSSGKVAMLIGGIVEWWGNISWIKINYDQTNLILLSSFAKGSTARLAFLWKLFTPKALRCTWLRTLYYRRKEKEESPVIGGNWTYNLWIMRLVLYHCATAPA